MPWFSSVVDEIFSFTGAIDGEARGKSSLSFLGFTIEASCRSVGDGTKGVSSFGFSIEGHDNGDFFSCSFSSFALDLNSSFPNISFLVFDDSGVNVVGTFL